MTGTAGQKRLPRAFFETHPFPLPPLAEQRRIVAKVDEVMGVIDRLEAAAGEREAVLSDLRDVLLDALANSPDAAATAEAWSALAPNLDRLLATPADVDRLHQTILQLAVKGRLVPQDPTDEPAATRPLGALVEVMGGSTPSKRDPRFGTGRSRGCHPKI